MTDYIHYRCWNETAGNESSVPSLLAITAKFVDEEHKSPKSWNFTVMCTDPSNGQDLSKID